MRFSIVAIVATLLAVETALAFAVPRAGGLEADGLKKKKPKAPAPAPAPAPADSDPDASTPDDAADDA